MLGRGVVPSLLIVASIGLVSCGLAGTTVSEPAGLDSTADLLAQGYTPEVSSCVVGLLDSRTGESTRSELIATCQRASDMLVEAGKEPPVEIPFSGPTTYGDDPVLDSLWDLCELGDGGACDALWERAPVGSEYEEFGVTCGNRPDVLNCSDLVLADE